MITRRVRFCFMFFFLSCFILTGSFLSAQEKGPPTEVISGAYRQILGAADKNGDGKLSMEECLSISKNQKKAEKDCKYGKEWVSGLHY